MLENARSEVPAPKKALLGDWGARRDVHMTLNLARI
jgi:hypothetical protein